MNLRIVRKVWHVVRMRIVCPSCHATYEVADSLVVPGRIVQCARCHTEWVALTVEAPEVDELEAEILPDEIEVPAFETPRLTAMDRLTQAASARTYGDGALRAAWAGSLVLLLALGWAFFAWRVDLMHAWPASIRLYSAFGLATSPH
jgi:predicted Zn finger-like uncharacterized protein